MWRLCCRRGYFILSNRTLERRIERTVAAIKGDVDLAKSALETIRHRNDFYRDNYRKTMTALLVSIVLNILLILILGYLTVHHPAPTYFATSSDGRLTPLTPLDRPNMAQKTVLQWAVDAATSVYTYDYVNYRKQLQASSGFFTATGWKQFLSALDSSKNLDTVKARKLVVSAVATGAPVLLNAGLISGIYNWRVQLPLQVTYQGSSQSIPQSLVVTLTIRRESTLDSPSGLGIAQFIVQQNTGAT